MLFKPFWRSNELTTAVTMLLIAVSWMALGDPNPTEILILLIISVILGLTHEVIEVRKAIERQRATKDE